MRLLRCYFGVAPSDLVKVGYVQNVKEAQTENNRRVRRDRDIILY